MAQFLINPPTYFGIKYESKEDWENFCSNTPSFRSATFEDSGELIFLHPGGGTSSVYPGSWAIQTEYGGWFITNDPLNSGYRLIEDPEDS